MARRKPQPRERNASRHHKKQCWQNTPRSTLIEIQKRERACLDLSKDDGRDQIATDHKEDVDPDKSTAKEIKACVEKNYGQDSQSPQAVNFGSVS
jgi:hypothetical protein